MPYCGYLTDAGTEKAGDRFLVRFAGPCNPEELRIVDILKRAFPGVWISSLQVQHEYDYEHFVPNYVGQIDIADAALERELNRLLGLLKEHITVADQSDECHALAMHSYPDPDPEANTFHRTKIGSLVHRAKPYSPWSGDLDEAHRLAAHLEEFIVSHPAYARASWLFPAPPSSKAKRFDLPSVLAETITGDLNISLGRCIQIREVKPQKNVDKIEDLRENRRNSVRIDEALEGQAIILLDDIYRSGQTIGDMVRAAREARASEVLALTATKTMKFAQGLSL